MKFAILTLFPVLSALAAPSRERAVLVPRTLTYDASNPPTLFTDPTCSLSQYLTDGEPLSFAYPLADQLGTLIVTPALRLILGEQTIEDLDLVADQACVNAQKDPLGGNGICQDTLQAIRDFAEAHDPLDQVHKYNCLLNLLCIAHTGVPYQGTCNFLLAGLDCIANRLIGVQLPECT